MKRFVSFILPACLLCLNGLAQTTFPSNGAPHNPHSLYAFTNAVIFLDYETTLKNGTLLIQNGKVISAGEKIEVPKHAVVFDLKGKYIYPSFIDLYSDYGLPSNRYTKKDPGPQMESSQKGAFGWNMSVRSNQEAYKSFLHNSEKADEYRRNGFGTVLTAFKDGVVRGSGVLLNLNTSGRENESVLIDKAAGFYS